jgi:DNA-binding MarR family transcriptional regulator
MQQLTGANRRDDVVACAEAVVQTGLAVSRLVRAQLRRGKASGLTLPQLRALGFVNADPACAPSQLAEYLMLSRPAVTRLIDDLVRRRLITRRPHPGDRRRLRLSVTAAGRARLEAYFAQARAVVAARLDALSPRDRDTVERAMRLVLPLVAPTPTEDA